MCMVHRELKPKYKFSVITKSAIVHLDTKAFTSKRLPYMHCPWCLRSYNITCVHHYGRVPPKRNITLTCKWAIALTRIIISWMGVAPSFLASIYPVYSRVNTCKQNGCHTPLISDNSSMLLFGCDAAFEQYHMCHSYTISIILKNTHQLSYSIFEVNICSFVHQILQTFNMVVHCSYMQWCLSIL